MGAAGTDVAMETADVVLMSDNLQNIVFALALSRNARRVIYQNLSFALAVIIVLIISALGFSLLLPIGVVAHAKGKQSAGRDPACPDFFLTASTTVETFNSNSS